MPRTAVLRSRSLWIAIPIVVVVVAALIASDDGGVTTDPTATRIVPTDQRSSAPERQVELLEPGGGPFSLSSVRGHVTVVNFWASWCGPCRREQPELNDAHRELASDGVRFVGVAVNDPVANARAHWTEFDVPYPSVLDPDASYAAAFGGIGPSALPTTLVLDRDGRIAARIFGETDAEEVIAVAARILEGD